MIEVLELRVQGACTCLVKACDEIGQRYPDLAPQITVFSGQLEEFRHAISGSSRSVQDPSEHAICFDANENARPDSSEAPLTLEPGIAVVGEAVPSLVIGIQHMESLDVEYTQIGMTQTLRPTWRLV
jgi:hypothetical protein